MSEHVEEIGGVPATADQRKTLYESMELERTGGGAHLLPRNFAEMMALANLMQQSDVAVPPHLRGNVGACFAVAMQAVRWGMDPFAVAGKSYLVASTKNPEPKLAYESGVLAAVVHTRAGLKKRPESEYINEGEERTCKVTFTFTNGDVRTYTSPRLRDIKVKNSPLWFSEPDQQLYYYSIRAAARRWTPEILLGVYDRDEMEGAEPLRDITPRGDIVREKPDLASKLKGGGEGFSAEHIARETNGGPKVQHMIDHQPGEVMPIDAEAMEREIEPVRTGNTIPGETVGAVRADAKGKKRGGKKDAGSDVHNTDSQAGATPVASHGEGASPATDAAQMAAQEPPASSNEEGAASNQTNSISDTALLTKLADTLKDFVAEKAIRNRWHIEFEALFKDRPEKVRGAAGTIINANIARVKDDGGEKMSAEECMEHCDRAIARVATEGDLFA